MTYDSLGDLLTTQGSDTPSVSYTYDGLQRQIQTVTPNVTTGVCYSAYASSRTVVSTLNAPPNNPCPASGSSTATQQTKVQYNLFGEPTQAVRNYVSGQPTNSGIAFDTNVTSVFTYDAAGNLLSMQAPNDASGVPSQTFSYDKLNRLLTNTRLLTAGTSQAWTTAYDGAGRSVQIVAPANASGGGPITTTTTYDNLDGLKQVQRSGGQTDTVTLATTFTLVSGTSGSNAMYARQVAMTDVSSKPGTPTTTTYSYDALDRLSSVSGGINNLPSQSSGSGTIANPLSYSYDLGWAAIPDHAAGWPNGRLQLQSQQFTQ